MGLISGIIDRMAQRAEDEASLLLGRYREMLSSSAEARSIKAAASENSGTSVAERAFRAHRQIFAQVLESAPGLSLVKSKQRVRMVEQFCLAMWVKFVGQDRYQAMVQMLKETPPATKSQR